jgi:peroxiredoxin
MIAAAEALADAFVRCRDMDAALGERLEAYSNAVREFIPAYADAVDQLVSRLSNSGAGLKAPRPGEPMPPFVLPDDKGRLTSLESLLKNGPAAITFHRGHWCPWCRISAIALAQAQCDIAAAGGQIAAIMPERQRLAVEFRSNTKSPFPVFTDVDNGYALCHLGGAGSRTAVVVVRTFVARLPRKRGLGAAHSGDLRGWAGRHRVGMLYRSGFSATDVGR